MSKISKTALKWPIIKALQQLGGQAHRSKIRELVISNEGISATLLNQKNPSGKYKFNTSSSWAFTSLKRAGYLVNHAPGKGVWTLTKEGQNATASDFS